MSINRNAYFALNEQNKLVINRVIFNKNTHWIELDIRDEHNEPFKDITGILTDSAGVEHKVSLTGEPVKVIKLPPGKVNFKFDEDEWLPLVKARKSRTEQDSPVEEYAAEEVGHESTQKQCVKVTSGDLLDLSDKDLLPEQHRKINGDKEYFIELDNSYVLEVKGFNYLTIRLGMFFDGTTNNTYSAEWGKTLLDDYSIDWVEMFQKQQSKDPKKFAGDLFEFPSVDASFGFDKTVTGSAANEITNVEKMKRLYNSGVIVENTYVDKLYITGIGTGNDTDNTKPADEPVVSGVLMGQAFGGGPYGILKKVATAIELIGSQLKTYLDKADSIEIKNETDVSYDGIAKIEFDVFGFSRGSAAARHFINVILDGENGDFAKHTKAVCKDEKITLAPEFKWKEVEQNKLIIKFAGLFDTVASVIDITENDWKINNADTGAVRLWLDPAGVEKAVHFTAHKKTEYRKNFCSNKLNLDGLKSNNQFEEHELPGAHSDVGGAYHSIHSFEDKSFHLPLLENKLVFETWVNKKTHSKEDVSNLLEDEVERLRMANGWGDIFKRVIELRTDHKKHSRSRWQGKLFVTRSVKGDLSRLYLRVMHGLAYKYNVPLTNESAIWESKSYSITDSFDFRGYSLDKIAEKAHVEALEGHVLDLIKTDDFRKALVEQSFIHHSAGLDVANVPNDCLERVTFECREGE